MDIYYLTTVRKLNIRDEISGYAELLPGVNITTDLGACTFTMVSPDTIVLVD